MGEVIPFPDRSLPLTGAKRLRVRRVYREGCASIAAEAVMRALHETVKLPGATDLGYKDAIPIFVGVMRRELRKSGLF